jgi:hypothetical protein
VAKQAKTDLHYKEKILIWQCIDQKFINSNYIYAWRQAFGIHANSGNFISFFKICSMKTPSNHFFLLLILGVFAAGCSKKTTSTRPGTEGKPDASNTGVPAGTALKKFEGDLIVDAEWVSGHSDKIDAMDISGGIYVRTNNIRITRCRIRQDIYFYDQGIEYGQALIEDCEIGPESGACGHDAGVTSGHDITVRRCNIHNCIDGIYMGGPNWTIERNYIHHSYFVPGDHADAVQSEEIKGPGYLRIIGNNADCMTAATGSSGPFHDALMGNGLDPATGSPAGTPSLELTIEGNWLSGGGYTLAVNNRWRSLSITNNKFGRIFDYGVISLGKIFGNENGGTLEFTWTNNTYEDNGEQIQKP